MMNAVLSLDGKRGVRMSEEEAESILKNQGFTLITYVHITRHKARSAETVITHYETGDYRRKARLRVTYSV